MAVLLADRALGVRRRGPANLDAHGDRVGGAWGPVTGPWPGRAAEGPDVPPGQIGGRAWVLAVDPRAWPIAQNDLVVDTGSGQEWLVTSADLLTNTADPTVTYIRVTGHLRTAAGTRP
ncbi:hypothetical protein [Microbispora sp. NPDC049125]|uniref:hypothetical protein n=1 Tax=Microbispora sp. NPDC049125 TaxID=3154929 RepID=UPI00346553C0